MTIYKITNIVNGKIYVGQTKMSLNLRWNRHVIDSKRSNTKMANAIKKYGVKSFKIEPITSGEFNQKVTDLLEIAYIALYKSADRMVGYNIKYGGNNSPIPQETKDKISAANKGRKITEEQMAVRVMKHVDRYSPEKVEEIKANYSKASAGGKNGRALQIIDTSTGEKFGCIKEVAVALNMSPVTLRWQIRNNKHPKYRYIKNVVNV